MPEKTVSPPRVLVVEDDDALRSTIAAHLRSQGFEVLEAATQADARAVVASQAVDAVVLEHALPDGKAFDLLPDVFARTPHPVVIVLTAHGSIDFAVRAIKAGVQQFVPKPVDLATLVRELRQYLGQRAALAKRAQPAAKVSGVSQRAVSAPFFGPAAASERLRDQLARLRGTDHPLLLVGEPGTGKSAIARYVHAMSSRTSGSFVEANAATVTDAELFGGSSRAGLVEAAQGGTLFFDEIGALDLEAQAKLAEQLESKCLGDVRVIAATNRDLAAAVRDGTFRSDLHERIAAVSVVVPPLRDRAEDIVPLARQLLDMLTTTLGRARATLSHDAEEALVAHTWPGNVRELKNCLERALIVGDGGLLRASDVQPGGVSLPPSSSLVPRLSGAPVRSLEYVEIEHIRTVLADVSGRVDAAAVELQMPRSTLYERIRRYNIDLNEFRARRKS